MFKHLLLPTDGSQLKETRPLVAADSLRSSLNSIG
jgi:hypothetical protein